MDDATKEILFDVLCGQARPTEIPDSVANDAQAIDWLFHLLLTNEFPSNELIGFLANHCSDDRRFRLWTHRAFRPGVGEDGMSSERAYQFLEKHDPVHPWLDPIMEQVVYCSGWCPDGFCAGKDFRSHLEERFGRVIGSHSPEPEIATDARSMDSSALQGWVANRDAPLKYRLRAADELLGRCQFHFFFSGSLDYQILEPVKQRMIASGTATLLAAARGYLAEEKCSDLAFELPLEHCTDPTEFLELFERSVELRWRGKFKFLKKLRETGDSVRPATILRVAMVVAGENRIWRHDAASVLLRHFGDDSEIIRTIKSWAEEETEEYKLYLILSEFLASDRELDWVRGMALQFQRKHDGCHTIFQILTPLHDEAGIQTVLDAFGSFLSGEVSGAISTAGRHLYQNSRVKERLIGKARDGDGIALQWVARRYPDDPATWEALKEAGNTGYPDWRLIELMCIQSIHVPHLRDRFVRSLGDPTKRCYFDCSAILALSHEREALAGMIFSKWERSAFYQAEFTTIYPMWFPPEPMMDRIVGKIRSGDLLENSREILLLASEKTDISGALIDGIRAATDRIDVGDAILLLGMIYGDRQETVRFLKEFIEYEPAMLKYGAEAAFAEVLRLSKRNEKDFEWAVNALEKSRCRPGGVAGHCPALLVHFFGSGPHVQEALQRFASSSGNQSLADASARLLLDKFPTLVTGGNRSAVEHLSAGERADYLRSLFSRAEEHLDDLIHFTLNDPEAGVRRAALGAISQALSWNRLPDTWKNRDFATGCLHHKELAQTAAGLLAKWYPEDEAVARLLISVAERFPEEAIFRTLVDSFGHTGPVGKLLFEVIRKSRDAAAASVGRPRCTCSKCLGFDLKEYSMSVLRLFLPPYDQIPEAAQYRQEILFDPWLDPSDPWRFVRAITHGLDDAGRILKYEEIIRGNALMTRKQWTLDALAQSAEEYDSALEVLLRLMEDPDENLRLFAAKSAKSISYNGRRYHRKLHELLRQQGSG